MDTVLNANVHTVCPRSLGPFYIGSYCIKRVKTSLTYSMHQNQGKITNSTQNSILPSRAAWQDFKVNHWQLHHGTVNRKMQKINEIFNCSRAKQMPLTDQITEITSYLRTYFCQLPSNISTMHQELCIGSGFRRKLTFEFQDPDFEFFDLLH